MDLHIKVLNDLTDENVIFSYIYENYKEIDWSQKLRYHKNTLELVQRKLFSKKKPKTISNMVSYYSFLEKHNLATELEQELLIENLFKYGKVDLISVLESPLKIIEILERQTRSGYSEALNYCLSKSNVEQTELILKKLETTNVKLNKLDDRGRSVLYYIDNPLVLLKLMGNIDVDFNSKDYNDKNIAEFLIDNIYNERKDMEKIKNWKDSLFNVFTASKFKIELSEDSLMQFMLSHHFKYYSVIKRVKNIEIEDRFFENYDKNPLWLNNKNLQTNVYIKMLGLLQINRKKEMNKTMLSEALIGLKDPITEAINPLTNISYICSYTDNFTRSEKKELYSELFNTLLNNINEDLTNKTDNTLNLRNFYYKASYLLLICLSKEDSYHLILNNRDALLKLSDNLGKYDNKDSKKIVDMFLYQKEYDKNALKTEDHQQSFDWIAKEEENIFNIFANIVQQHPPKNKEEIKLHLILANKVKKISNKMVDNFMETTSYDFIQAKNELKNLNINIYNNLFEDKKARFTSSKRTSVWLEKIILTEEMRIPGEFIKEKNMKRL